MKTRYLFLLLFIPIVYTACQKDDEKEIISNDSSTVTSEPIVSGWQLSIFEATTTQGYYENYPNGKVVLENSTQIWATNNPLDEIVSWYADFKENGKCIITSINLEGGIEIDTNNYMKQGDLLIFLDDTDLFEDLVHNIETLNNTTLRLNATEIDTGSYSGPSPVQDVVYFTEDGYTLSHIHISEPTRPLYI